MREKIPGAIVLFQNTPFGSSTIQKNEKNRCGAHPAATRMCQVYIFEKE
jgi:hypothetical protein